MPSDGFAFFHGERLPKGIPRKNGLLHIPEMKQPYDLPVDITHAIYNLLIVVPGDLPKGDQTAHANFQVRFGLF